MFSRVCAVAAPPYCRKLQEGECDAQVDGLLYLPGVGQWVIAVEGEADYNLDGQAYQILDNAENQRNFQACGEPVIET